MKDGGWIPLDKQLAKYLPLNRPYTELEAMFSYSKDSDEGRELALREYARIWGWSRTKVENFFEFKKASKEPEESQKKARRKPEFRFINTYLQDEKSHKKASKEPEESHKKATTINPNPNPNKSEGEKRFSPPTSQEVQAYCLERKNDVDPMKWLNFYTAKNWMIGKNKMKDWKAAVRTWETKSVDAATIQNPRLAF